MRVDAFEVPEPVPELHDTRAIVILRPWINVGRVGTQTLAKLKTHLNAKELGRLARPGTFYDFTQYRPRTRIVDGHGVLNLPNTIAHYAHDDENDRDYIFVEMREPHANGEDYADAIVALLKHFGVAEYCRIGGMYDSVPHTRPLLVTGSLTQYQMERAAEVVEVRRSTYQGPTSIVNQVTDALAQSDVVTTSLMVHLPQYIQIGEDHMGAARLTQALSAVYGFPTFLADSARGERQYRDLSRAVEVNNPGVKELIEELEETYDHRGDTNDPQEQTDVSFSPDVAEFLNQMGERLDSGKDDQ